MYLGYINRGLSFVQYCILSEFGS